MPRSALSLMVAALLVVSATAGPSTGLAASGVSTLSGNYAYDRTDAWGTVNGTPIPFKRTYNSLDTRVSPMGAGWTHNFAMHLAHPAPGSDDIILTGPGGRADTYTWNPDQQAFVPPLTLPGASLRWFPATHYSATQPDGTEYTFDPSGRLLAIAEPGKPRLTVDQGIYGPTQVLGPDGQPVLRFDYDAATSHLVSVTDVPDTSGAPVQSRVVRYAYDQQGRLASTIDRNNQVTHFTYDADTIQLQSIVDANGHAAITLAYDDQRRVSVRYDARAVVTQHPTVMQYATQSNGTDVTVETRVPSGVDPTFAPTMTSVYRDQALTSSSTLPGPGDDPEVLTWVYGGGSGVPVSSARSGGTTPHPNGSPASIQAGPPGGAAVRVGDAQDPLPAPVCISAPPIASAPEANKPWSTGSEQADPRLEVFRSVSVAGALATNQLYDGLHRLIGFRDARGGDWKVEYDAEDQPIHLVGPASDVAIIKYDPVGNVQSIQQPGGTSTFEYDERDSLAQAHWLSGTLARYEYDERGDLLRAVVDPADGSAEQVADYAFDGLHRIRHMISYPDWPNPAPTRRIEFEYDAAGHCAAYQI